jgi:TonB family protein
VPEKTATVPHKILVNTQLVTRGASKTAAPAVNLRNNARTINSAIKNLRSKLSSPTEVNLSGNNSVAYANYGSVVTSIYHQKWLTLEPAGMEKENAVVTFRVTIASDGTVISAGIIAPSGDANVDRAVQRMLDNVSFIAPFPESATEKDRTYIIDFNAIRTTE